MHTEHLNRKSVSPFLMECVRCVLCRRHTNTSTGIAPSLALSLPAHSTQHTSVHTINGGVCHRRRRRSVGWLYTIEAIQFVSGSDSICPPLFVSFAIQMKGKFQTVLVAMWPRAETNQIVEKFLLFIFCLIGG